MTDFNNIITPDNTSHGSDVVYRPVEETPYDVEAFQAEYLTTAESVALGFGKNLSDSVSFSDSFEKVFTFIRTFTDSVAVPDSKTTTLQDMALEFSDAAALVDSFSRVINDIAEYVDSLSLPDARVIAVSKPKSDSVSLTTSGSIITAGYGEGSYGNGLYGGSYAIAG